MVTQYNSMARTKKMADPSDFGAFIALRDSFESAIAVHKFTLIKKLEYEAIIQRNNKEIINLNKELEDSKTYVAELKAKQKHYKNVAAWYQSRMSLIKSAADDNGAAKIEADEDGLPPGSKCDECGTLCCDEPPAFPDLKRRKLEKALDDAADLCKCGRPNDDEEICCESCDQPLKPEDLVKVCKHLEETCEKCYALAEEEDAAAMARLLTESGV
jgi:hypothetical protein